MTVQFSHTTDHDVIKEFIIENKIMEILSLKYFSKIDFFLKKKTLRYAATSGTIKNHSRIDHSL